MKKIVLAVSDSKDNELFLRNLKLLFPECDIEIINKDTQSSEDFQTFSKSTNSDMKVKNNDKHINYK